MTPQEKIEKLLNDFGITGIKASEAMGVTYGTFRNKKNPNNTKHTFNEKNHQDLLRFIKNQSQKLI
jgi:hypothetical protein